MSKHKHLCHWPVFAFLFFFFLPIHSAEAGVFDRIKDIYNAPDKVNELRDQYEETAKSLEQQQQKLEEAATAMEKYAAKQQQLEAENSLFRQQNDELRAQLEQLEKDKADKQSLYRKWMKMILAAVAIVAGYILSIRIWRFAVWRRQRHFGGGT